MQRLKLRLAAVVALAALAAACGGSSSPTTNHKTPVTAFYITTLIEPVSITSPPNSSLFAPAYFPAPSAVVGVPYAFALETNVGATNTGTHTPVTFQVYNSSNWPPGLSLTPSGLIAGTPTQAGAYTVGVQAIDSTSPTPVVSRVAMIPFYIGQPGATLTQVGQNDLGGAGQNGDVTVQGHLAFVGTLGAGSPLSATPSAGGESCPATGIKVVDLSQADAPKLLTTITGTSGDAQPQAKAAMVTSAGFHSGSSGDLLAVAEAPCATGSGDSGVAGGVALYDVTNPASPVFLGRWTADFGSGLGSKASGWVLSNQGALNANGTTAVQKTMTAGVDSVAIVTSGSNIYVLAAVPGSEWLSGGAVGDLRVIDVTNPQNPTAIGSWNLSQAVNGPVLTATPKNTTPTLAADLAQVSQDCGSSGTASSTCSDDLTLFQQDDIFLGSDLRYFLDQIHTDTETVNQQPQTYAYLAYRDEGAIVLDVSDPKALVTATPQPAALAHIIYPVAGPYTATTKTVTGSVSIPEGNTHNALPVENGKALLMTDQICASTQTTSNNVTSFTNPSTAVVCGFSVPLTATQGWGFLRLYDLTVPSEPVAQGYAITAQSQSNPAPDDGIYTAQGLAWNGDATHPHAYVSWFSNGVLDVDFRSLSTPAVLAAFVPPATADPEGGNPDKNNPSLPLVYGVGAFNQNGEHYLVASDINSGLYVVQETAPPAFAIVTSSLPPANAGIPYSAQFESANSAGGVSYGLEGGALPPGLTLSAAGNLSGTPTTAGSYNFTVRARDANGDATDAAFSLTVTSNLAIVNSSNFPLATLNESYTATLQAANGTSPYTWAVSSGSLPAGLSLSSGGTLSGTPTQTGTSNFAITATDSASPANSATQNFSLTVATLEYASPSSLPDGGQDTAGYSYVLAAANGTGPFTFALANSTTLPPGLSLSSTGGITGTPTTAGTYTFSITMTDGDSQTATQQFTLTVEPFAISTTALPAGTVGTGYYFQLQLAKVGGYTIGASPFTYSVITGSLPGGLSLDSSSGVITGVPTTAGSSTFTVQVKDNSGATTQQTYTLVISSS